MPVLSCIESNGHVIYSVSFTTFLRRFPQLLTYHRRLTVTFSSEISTDRFKIIKTVVCFTDPLDKTTQTRGVREL